jgi:hypothetical protein
MNVSRPAVSRHLKVFKAAGLVVVRAAGTPRLYAVDTRGSEALRGWLDGFWDEALAAFKKAAEERNTGAIADRLGPHDASVLRSLQGEEHVVRLPLKSDIELVHWGGCLSTARPRALSSDHTLLLEHTDLAL